jgi:hypothetical protein
MNSLKTFLICGFLLGTFQHLFSQQVLSGTVYDEKNIPVPGVSICQGHNYKNGTFSDMDGEFTILVKEKYENSINFSLVGYNPVIITDFDTLNQPLTIIMKESTVLFDDDGYVNPPPNHDHNRFGYIFSYGAEGMYADFTEFEDVLEKYNTNFMSGFVGTINFDFTGTYKRFQSGIGFGFSDGEDAENDTLNVKLNITQYDLGFGYNIINSKYFLITPAIGLKWKRYRIINSSIDRKIPIEYYISQKDLDIRFNQTYAYSGLKIAFKPKLAFSWSDFWTIGLYGG